MNRHIIPHLLEMYARDLNLKTIITGILSSEAVKLSVETYSCQTHDARFNGY